MANAVWENPNFATNETGFDAHPTPWRDDLGRFLIDDRFGNFWTSTKNGGSLKSIGLVSSSRAIGFVDRPICDGIPVRCVK